MSECVCCTSINGILLKKACQRVWSSGRSGSGGQRAPCPSWSMQMEPEEMQKLLQMMGGGERWSLGRELGEVGGVEMSWGERAVRESGWGNSVIKKKPR